MEYNDVLTTKIFVYCCCYWYKDLTNRKIPSIRLYLNRCLLPYRGYIFTNWASRSSRSTTSYECPYMLAIDLYIGFKRLSNRSASHTSEKPIKVSSLSLYSYQKTVETSQHCWRQMYLVPITKFVMSRNYKMICTL